MTANTSTINVQMFVNVHTIGAHYYNIQLDTLRAELNVYCERSQEKKCAILWWSSSDPNDKQVKSFE